MSAPGPEPSSPKRFREWLRGYLAQLGSGQRIMSDEDLAGKWHISSRTVRRTMEELGRRGEVIRIRGKGTFKAGAAPTAEPGAASDEQSSPQTVAHAIVEAIQEGWIKHGDPLPKVKYLSLRYAVSERSVSAAYRILASRGFVTRIGRRFWVGRTQPWLPRTSRQEVWLAASSPEHLDTLFTSWHFAPAYCRFEEELGRCGVFLRCLTMQELSRAMPKAPVGRGNPIGIVFSTLRGSALRDRLDPLHNRFKGMGQSGVRMLVELSSIAGYDSRPPNTDLFARGHLNTAQARAIAEYVGLDLRRNAVILRSRGTVHDEREYVRMNKIIYSLGSCIGDDRTVHHVFLDQDGSRDTTHRLREAAALHPEYHDYLSRKFGSRKSSKEYLDGVHTVDDISAVYETFGAPVVWLCEDELLAVECLEVLRARHIAVPDRVAIICLRSSPQLIRYGVSSCAPSWGSLGYLMAHSLIGDIAIDRTSRRFLKVPCPLIQRMTTP